MGFDTYRTVEGGFICKTNHDKIRLKWSKWNSHRTRYAAFRGAIVYDRNSDIYLNSDKTKAISDDRPFHDMIRWNILHITDKYFAKMKTENGFYETDVQKRRELKMAEPTVSGNINLSPTLVHRSSVVIADTILENQDGETKESLIEILCAFHGKPGDKLLANTFYMLASSEKILKNTIENIRMQDPLVL
jgi:hypothetical protein